MLGLQMILPLMTPHLLHMLALHAKHVLLLLLLQCLLTLRGQLLRRLLAAKTRLQAGLHLHLHLLLRRLLLLLLLMLVPELQLTQGTQGAAGGSQPVLQVPGQQDIAEQAGGFWGFATPSGQAPRVQLWEEQSWGVVVLALGTAAADARELQVRDGRRHAHAAHTRAGHAGIREPGARRVLACVR